MAREWAMQRHKFLGEAAEAPEISEARFYNILRAQKCSTMLSLLAPVPPRGAVEIVSSEAEP